jgi:hypothetical protein
MFPPSLTPHHHPTPNTSHITQYKRNAINATQTRQTQRKNATRQTQRNAKTAQKPRRNRAKTAQKPRKSRAKTTQKPRKNRAKKPKKKILIFFFFSFFFLFFPSPQYYLYFLFVFNKIMLHLKTKRSCAIFLSKLGFFFSFIETKMYRICTHAYSRHYYYAH